MTQGGITFPAQSLAVWQRLLRHPQRLWAGTLRLWQTECALAPPGDSVSTYLQRVAETSGTSVQEIAQRFGVRPPLGANGEHQTNRTTVNFVDVPSGPVRIELKGLFLPGWPNPLEPSEVPSILYQPLSTGGMPLHTDNWHTVPVVRALAFMGAAALIDDSIAVYALKPSAGTIVPEPLFRLPTHALPLATDEEWQSAWQRWCAAKRIAHLGPIPSVTDAVAAIASNHPAHEQLKSMAEIANHEAWLFAGNGPFHEIARVTVS